MATYRGAHAGNRSWRLSQLYSDAKQQYRQAISAPSADASPEVQSLSRKFRLQKDRLIAWGFDWSDGDSPNSDGAIDESVERAGLTEVVSSILENIIQMIDEVEKMRARSISNAPGSSYPLEKVTTWDDSDRLRFTDLTRDITSSIDLLCELSKNKPSQPSRAEMPDEKRQLAAKYSLQNYEAEAGLVPEPSRSVASVQAQKLSPSRILMPEEAPPPYEPAGLPCPVRIIGQLRTSDSSNASSVPVLIEYARFDKIYRENNVPLPLNRVENLSKLMSSKHASRPAALLNLLGYFEDKSRPRVGMVYEIPSWATGVSNANMKPTSLHDLLLASSKTQPTANSPNTVPALEERYRLASELAIAFRAMMEGSFLHRDINSNSVSFLPTSRPRRSSGAGASNIFYALKKPVLGGFDLFSEFDIDVFPDNLQQNMYRHPDDPRINKGSVGSDNYNLRFDVYSVGLVLLEIGLWVPLGDLFKEKYSLNDFSVRLEKIWIPRLSSKCGTAYMAAVRECVAAGNDANISEGALRMTYERITSKLARCCLLDDDSDASEEASGLAPLANLVPPTSQSPLQPRHTDSPGPRRSARAPSIPRKPLPSTTSSQDVKEPLESDLRKRHQIAPSGAFPQAPMEPDFEISSFGASPRARNQMPLRYTFPFVQLPKDVRDNGRLIAKRLCKIGERVLDPKETSSIAIHGFGETESTCKPTFCIMCTNTRKFYKAVRKNLDFDKTTFDLIIFKGDVVRSKSTKAYRSNARSGGRLIDEVAAKNPGHHPRPLCGASIGAYKDFEHLPPVSFGGIVMVDGQYFGMTVHHMLESPDEEDEEDEEQLHDLRKSRAPGQGSKAGRSMAAKRQDSDFTLETMAGADELSDVDSEMLDDDDDSDDAESITFSDIEDDDAMSIADSTAADAGDTDGVPIGGGKNIAITQPALADVDDDFFPVEEDKDDDHLDSHTFGELYASSGIRRLSSKGARHEIDWALFRLDQNRLQPCNVVPGGRRYYHGMASPKIEKPKLRAPVCRKPFQPHEDHYPAAVLSSDDMSNQPVHCFGRTSGLSTGRVGTFMEYVKMVGRSTWSESWVVHAVPADPSDPQGPNLGVPGDSGAWIIDNEAGKVCGHVLAWSEKKKTAYIAPMDVMLSDIKDTLGARSVNLPGQDFASAAEETGKSETKTSIRTAHVLNPATRGDPNLVTTAQRSHQDAPEVERVDGHGRTRHATAPPSPPPSPVLLSESTSLAGPKQSWAAQCTALGLETTD